MKLSLRNRILAPTLALVVLVTAVVSGIAYRSSSNALDAAVDDHMQSICQASVRQIETWLGGQEDALTVLAGQENLRRALGPSETTASVRQEVSEDLARMKSLLGFYEDVHLIDDGGVARASSNPGSIDQLDVADREYFKDARKGTRALSAVLTSRTTGNPIVVAASPVQRDGQTVGVLIGVLNLDWFSSRFISNLKVLQSGYVFVHDEAGVFVAHPQKDKILKSKLADFPWGARVLQEKEGHLDYEFEGVRKSAVFSTSESLGWGVVATVPVREAQAAARRMAVTSLGVGLLALIGGVALALLIARSINRPIKRVVDSLHSGSDETTSAAGQVAASSQSLAEGASEQAASLEETSSSLEELSSMTKRNSENTGRAGELAAQTRTAADSSVQEMQIMGAAMDAIQRSSDEVGKIIKTIDEIAFQTNILALNAAVEAARAGEAGMGFAVVADEVRNLAQRSAEAAKQTAAKIQAALENTRHGVDSSAKVSAQLETIVGKVRQMDELMAEITAASREQTEGINQINTAVSQMDKVTQSNAATAEESASAAEELNAQAASLRQAVGDLVALVEGTRTPSGALVPSAGGPAPRAAAAAPGYAGSRRAPIAVGSLSSRPRSNSDPTVTAMPAGTDPRADRDDAFRNF